MSNFTRVPSLFLLSPLLLSSAALAESTADAATQVERIEVTGSRASQGYLIEENSSATKLDLSLKETPQAISIISTEQLNDFALSNINLALDQATGVSVERIETDRTYYKARGFDITNFQVDGLGLPFTGGGIEGDLDTAIYQQVEVVRGANGLMSGVGNPSATVNMVRKRPTAEFAAQTKFSYGSWQDKRLDADVQGELGEGLAARAVAVKQDKNSYLDRYSHDKTLGYVVVDAELTDSTSLVFGHSGQHSEGKGGMWGALNLFYGNGEAIAYDTAASTSADWSYWQVKDHRSFVELQHKLNDNWALISSYQLMDIEQQGDLFYVYVSGANGVDPATGLGTTGYGSFYGKEEQTQLGDLYLKGKFELASRQHELVAGLNISDRDYTDVSLYDYSTGLGFPAMPAPAAWNGKTAKPVFKDGKAGSDVNAKQQSVYSAVRWDLADSLKLITGARWIKAEVTGLSYGVDQGTEDKGAVPYVGAVYELTPQISLYSSHTAIFLPQNERDANRKLLKAVEGSTVEFGLKSSLFNDKALLSLAVFDIKQQNMAVFDKDIVDPVAGLFKAYKTAEEINSRGVELELTGAVTEALQLSASFVQLDIDGDKLVEAYTPKRTMKLSAVYQLPQLPGLNVGLNYRWQDDISRVQGQVAAIYVNAGQDIVTRQDAYGVLGLMASYDLSSQWQIQLNADNLTDEKYLNSLYWAQAYYGAPVNYRLGVSYQF